MNPSNPDGESTRHEGGHASNLFHSNIPAYRSEIREYRDLLKARKCDIFHSNWSTQPIKTRLFLRILKYLKIVKLKP